MKRVCIVGYGAIGPIHAAAVEKCMGAEVYAVCDTNSERLEAGAKKHGAIAYSSFEDALRDENIDSIHICTPHYLHLSMTQAALAAGKEVVCEKPVTMNESEFDALLATEGSDRICVVFQNRLNPCVEALKKMAESGELGKIITAKGIVTWCRTEEYYKNDSWRGKWATEGGGVLINQSIHTLDLLGYVVGDIKSVKATMSNFSLDSIEVEDTVAMHISFEGGQRGIFFATNAYGTNSSVELEVVFEKGRARYSDGKLFVDGTCVAIDDTPTIGKMYWGRGHELLISDYYDKNKFFSLGDVENSMRAAFAAYQSASAQGKEIQI